MIITDDVAFNPLDFAWLVSGEKSLVAKAYAKHVAACDGFSIVPEQEFRDAAEEALGDACRKYDSEKRVNGERVKFETFAMCVIRNRLIDLTRKKRPDYLRLDSDWELREGDELDYKGREPLTPNEYVPGNDESGTWAMILKMEQTEVTELIQDLLSENPGPEAAEYLRRAGVSRRDRYIVREILLNGKTQCDLAARLKISQPRIAKIHKAALKKLRAALNSFGSAASYEEQPTLCDEIHWGLFQADRVTRS